MLNLVAIVISAIVIAWQLPILIKSIVQIKNDRKKSRAKR